MRMSPSRALLLCFSAFALLPACAKKKDSNASSSSIYTIPADNLSDAQKKAMNASVNCEGDCSASVGLLAIANSDSGGQCTASLIGEDLVVTNSHCVASDLKAPGSSCQGRLWLHFAADKSHPEYDSRLECEKVLYASPIDGEIATPDYAYLKLSRKSNRPTLRFSRGGFADLETYTLHKVNPARIPGKLSGSLGTTTCRAVYNSDVVDTFFHSQAPVAMLSDCTVIQGNSGGPILAADGSVRGVIFAFLQPEILRRRLAKRKGAELRESFLPINLASNFACLREQDDPAGNRLPGTCAAIEAMEKAKASERPLAAAELLLSTFERDYGKAMSRAYPGFEWTGFLETAGPTVEVRPIPYCVRASSLSTYLGKSVSVVRPVAEVIDEFDRYTRRTPALKRMSATVETLTLTGRGREFSARITGLLGATNHKVVLCP